jgi:tRNA pseudouridine38-40 synthase
MYYFIKYGYDGTKFSGFQRGNGRNSVEDSIINTLSRYEICQNIESAARTDRNVSANGNVFLINTERNIIDIMGILNAELEDMFFLSYAILKNYMNPRHNSMKMYSYILTERHDMEDLMNRLYEFKGTHDFRNFCKLDTRNTVRTIDNISYSKVDKFSVINFYGKSFIWHQLRSIMAFVLSGNTDPFSLKKKYTYLAPPEPLILRDIMYDGIAFTEFNYIKHKRYMQRTSDLIKIRYVLYEIFNGNI